MNPIFTSPVDTSTVSAIDLEKIAETETPPQSPTNTDEEMMSAFSGTTESSSGITPCQNTVRAHPRKPGI